MAKMIPPSAEKYPELKKAWDDYEHAIPWEKLIDYKIQFYSKGGAYVALAWKHKGGMIEYADLECVNGVWDMNNDGGEPVTLKEWQAARCKPECNWLDFPEEM